MPPLGSTDLCLVEHQLLLFSCGVLSILPETIRSIQLTYNFFNLRGQDFPHERQTCYQSIVDEVGSFVGEFLDLGSFHIYHSFVFWIFTPLQSQYVIDRRECSKTESTYDAITSKCFQSWYFFECCFYRVQVYVSLSSIITINIILLLWEFYITASIGGLSLFHSKSLQVSRVLLSILTDHNKAVFWMVSSRVLISNSSSPFTNPLATVRSSPITIGITVIFNAHSFL